MVIVNTWLDISSKYIEDFCDIGFFAVGIFSERLTDICVITANARISPKQKQHKLSFS